MYRNSYRSNDLNSKEEIKNEVSIEKRKENTVRIQDFYKRIKPKM